MIFYDAYLEDLQTQHLRLKHQQSAYDDLLRVTQTLEEKIIDQKILKTSNFDEPKTVKKVKETLKRKLKTLNFGDTKLLAFPESQEIGVTTSCLTDQSIYDLLTSFQELLVKNIGYDLAVFGVKRAKDVSVESLNLLKKGEPVYYLQCHFRLKSIYLVTSESFK